MQNQVGKSRAIHSIIPADCGAAGKFMNFFHVLIIGNAVFNVKVKSNAKGRELSIRRINPTAVFYQAGIKKNLTNPDFKGNCKSKN